MQTSATAKRFLDSFTGTDWILRVYYSPSLNWQVEAWPMGKPSEMKTGVAKTLELAIDQYLNQE